jgi:Fur family peroxide stress response transcriptional regulator
MNALEITNLLKENKLKVTPQRVLVWEAFLKAPKHPTADQIIKIVKRKNPNISAGTIYKTLETFAQNNIIKKVKTEKDIMRYDSVTDSHHHLYCAQSDRIEDYYDPELNQMIEQYFRKKEIPDFKLEEFKIQFVGRFQNSENE